MPSQLSSALFGRDRKPYGSRCAPNNSFKPNLLRGGSMRLALR